MPAIALTSLADKLVSLSSPPSLRSLLGRLAGAEDYAAFMRLVHEYLPEEENEIKRLDGPAAQIAHFAERFSDRYFPLWDVYAYGEEEEYSGITRQIPVVALGLDENDFQELESGNFDDGHTLMSYLFQHPYGDGEHVALAETCAKIVPKELLLRVPVGGINLEEAHRLLDKTRFEAVALWGDRLHYNTGNSFYDNDMENAYAGCPEWDKETVKELTQEWLNAQALDNKVQKISKWLGEDTEAHFAELLDFIEKRQVELDDGTNIAAHLEAAKQQLRLPLYQPTESDKAWLSSLMQSLAVGGTWQAPMGFCFEKVSNTELKLKWLTPGHEVMDAIQQTIATGQAIGVTVNTDGMLLPLEGGVHDDRAGRCSRRVGLVPAHEP